VLRLLLANVHVLEDDPTRVHFDFGPIAITLTWAIPIVEAPTNKDQLLQASFFA